MHKFVGDGPLSAMGGAKREYGAKHNVSNPQLSPQL